MHGYHVSLLGWDRTAELPETGFQELQGCKLPVHRLRLLAPFGHGLANLPNLLRWQWRLSGWLVQHRRDIDLIHACDFDTILPALLCKWLWHKKVIYDIFDFYADHLRATPAWIKRLIRSLDLWAINRSDALILADDSRWEQVSGAHPRRSVVIYNSPAPQELPAPDEAPAESAVTLRIAYIGLLQVERGLLEMLVVLKKHHDWHLDLAGFGGDEHLMRATSDSMENCHWHGRVSYERALQLSQAADVLFATYDPAIPNHRYSSPNKIFEAMMLAKPIIVARHTNMDRIITQVDCGIVVEYGDVDALENALLELERDPELRQRLGYNGRKAYQATYSWAAMEKRLAQLYSEVIEANNT